MYTKQNTDRMLKFDWLKASPYTCVRTGVWTGWTSVHNNKGKHWLFVVLLVWVYNKALINLEYGPYGKYLLWRHAARTSLRSVRTAWRHNKYFRVWTTLSVNKSIVCFMLLQWILKQGVHFKSVLWEISLLRDFCNGHLSSFKNFLGRKHKCLFAFVKPVWKVYTIHCYLRLIP